MTDLLLNRADVHHVYPRQHLKDKGLSRGNYNQIANYVIAQSEINIGIGAKAPTTYFDELSKQCAGGERKYGGILDRADMLENFRMNCIPESMLDGGVKDFDMFLAERRGLMALKIKKWFESL